MQNTKRYDLSITGNGSSAGGAFRDVKIVGDANIDGDVDCLAFKCTGTTRITGHVKSTSCSIMGTVDLKGNLETGEAKITGTLDVDGDVKAQEMKSNGDTRIRGSVFGEDIKLEGLFKIGGNCEAESLQMKGVFRIKGLLNVGLVDLKLHSKCEVKEIGGEKIEIRRGNGFVLKRWISVFFLPSDFYEGTLMCDSIEGDDIYVEYTSAKVIRGSNITIGPGCHIGQVEYTGTFQQAEDTTVTQCTKL
ncbi:polymer-forming cytoskeletal protein [Paenibacillus cremeus]|uniref:Cell shape determination protein CcmA n=1 Tax=Paenibacillus cremeus TaxID=2163881 RepID=A0A559KA30_9BACL|nr:polymer-forming cytoskeletal protein [Paenibacillus cremeus]TVY08990.1 cell shape determination protein CcmA [Paenibacillus cremeus]